MTDEKYVLLQDTREKKNVARSARKRKTHAGKGGRVKLPSDYLTKKELKAMSGAVESYKLNSPMTWVEFKKMPDDIKVDYIKLIREKYGASDSGLAEMFGVSNWTVCQEMKRLGISNGKNKGRPKWDKEGFFMWVNRVPMEQTVLPEAQEAEEEVVDIPEIPEAPAAELERIVPVNGRLAYDGRVEDIFTSVLSLIGNAEVRMEIRWEVSNNG